MKLFKVLLAAVVAFALGFALVGCEDKVPPNTSNPTVPDAGTTAPTPNSDDPYAGLIVNWDGRVSGQDAEWDRTAVYAELDSRLYIQYYTDYIDVVISRNISRQETQVQGGLTAEKAGQMQGELNANGYSTIMAQVVPAEMYITGTNQPRFTDEAMQKYGDVYWFSFIKDSEHSDRRIVYADGKLFNGYVGWPIWYSASLGRVMTPAETLDAMV
jgi:hypothetical protein